MPLRQAIEDYHALLDDELAGETEEQLQDQQRRRGLFFGSRPLCTVLRPRFLTPTQYDFLRTRVGALLPTFQKVHDRAMADATFMQALRPEAWEEQLIRHDPGFPGASLVSRLDAFYVEARGGLRFTEYNAETPAATSYNDVLAEIFYGLPVMRQFLKRYEVRQQPSRHNVMHVLLDAYQAWLGRRARPVGVAIIDWREVPTYSEFVITADYLNAQGLRCVIADPREIEYRAGKLWAGGTQVDLIYKRVLINELIERGGMDHPVVRAVLDGAVCMVNPFRCKLLHKKASLAVLSDERHASMFSDDELQAIAMHIPWTRLLEERKTVVDGEHVDLVEHTLRNRERLVLKPNDDYGGTGIVLGWEVDDATWAERVAHALAYPYIVQERVAVPHEAYPSMAGGRVEFAERVLDTAPFIFHGTIVDGCLTRLSTDPLVNVTAGGGSSLATFVVEARA